MNKLTVNSNSGVNQRTRSILPIQLAGRYLEIRSVHGLGAD